MSTIVEVAGLSHGFGDRRVLDDISFRVPTGALVALVGPTGCGKSTLLRILAGLTAPDAGSARIDGLSTRAGRRTAYMPQGDTLFPWRSALRNATLGAQVAGADRRLTEERARDLFARFGLAGFEDAWPATLSGGMRQRVALLRTILTDRPVLLLDEPFASLDAITRADIQRWLADLLLVETRTALLVTHDVDEAMRLADVILLLSPRPARIVDTVTLPDVRPRSAIRVTETDFAIVKRHVLEVLAGR